MKTVIIQYNAGNIQSVLYALERIGCTAEVTDNPEQILLADKVIFPGVGEASTAMNYLRNRNLDQLIIHLKQPVLGICLGMQLLATQGNEGGTTPGLRLLDGEVVRLAPAESERIPHVGWNRVDFIEECHLCTGLQTGLDFYFVHSYTFVPASSAHILGTTPYAGGFVSMIGNENIWGVQFHPEKSSKAGLEILRNFLNQPC